MYYWDDRDGAVPLSGSDWRDAWEEAGYPRDAQYTYDGRANRMLSHRYQNRYDRVFLFDGSKLVCSKLARVAGFNFREICLESPEELRAAGARGLAGMRAASARRRVGDSTRRAP